MCCRTTPWILKAEQTTKTWTESMYPSHFAGAGNWKSEMGMARTDGNAGYSVGHSHIPIIPTQLA